MSKSKGDFLTVSLLQEKGYDPIVYRMFCLQSHYRKPLEFSYEVLDNMAAAYKKLTKRIAELRMREQYSRINLMLIRQNLRMRSATI